MNRQQEWASGEEGGGGNEARGASASAVTSAPAETGMDAAAEGRKKPMMIYLLEDPTLAARIEAPQLERVLVEIQQDLQGCSIPPDEFAQKYHLSEDKLEKAVGAQEYLIGSILMVDKVLAENRNDDGALASYFRCSICTPRNLEAMLMIMDPNTRTDDVRSRTFGVLRRLTTQNTSGVWNETLSNGLRFATNYLFELAKSLEHRADDNDDFIGLQDTEHSMLICIIVTKDAPIEILNRICPLDWSSILENQRTSHRLYVYVAQILIKLHNLAECKPEVTDMLRSFGSCFGLLRNVLKTILRLRFLSEMSSPDDIHEAIDWMFNIVEFISLFYACMSGAPPQEAERELDILFNCVHSTLNDARPYVVNHLQTCTSGEASLPWLSVSKYDEFLALISPQLWSSMKESTVQRERFKEIYLSESGSTDKKYRKDVRSRSKTYLRENRISSTGVGDLCVNCLTVRDRASEGPFQMCSLCKQVAYCGRSCQHEHWKRIHRANCARNSGKQK